MIDISVILDNPGFCAEEIESLIENLMEGCVEVVLADPGYLRVLNRKYRHIDKSTDVLSFDLAIKEEDRPEGTIYVDGRMFPPMEALLERIFHGYLHLKGYSHNNEKDAGIMSSEVDSLVADALGTCPTMKHWHKTPTAGHNARRLSSNTSSILLKSPSIISKLCESSAQCTLPDKFLEKLVEN